MNIKKEKFFFYVEQEKHRWRCSHCGCKRVSPKGIIKRKFKSVPIGKKPVIIVLTVQRVHCEKCNKVRQVKIDFALINKTYTRSFMRYVHDLSRNMTISDIAKHLGVSWGLIKEIQKNRLMRLFRRPKLKNLKYIAIDEISIGKGHRYLTIVLDLNSGRVIYVGHGKGADALDDFWKRIKRVKTNNIKAIAIDMSPAYICAVRENLPNADIVFDHFHVIKMFNEKISDFRRKLFHEVQLVNQQSVLKGVRWLLLKNPENLDDNKHNESERLKSALELNISLATVYYMKEDLRSLWQWEDKKTGAWHLDSWIKMARASKIHMLQKFADTLAFHRFGILNYFDHFISTGPLEGTNNKIKTMKRQAYGFRDIEFFKLKIYALHETKYALVG